MKEKEIIDKLKELQNDSFEWSGVEDLIDFIKKLQEENEKLKEITNGYNSLKKASEAFGGIPIIIADEKYFNDSIFKESYINKDKIRDFIKRLEKDVENIREKKKDSHDYDRSSSRIQAYLTKTNEIIKRLKELLEEE